MAKMRLEDQMRALMRRRGMAIRTEDSYVSWYRRYVKFHNLQHPLYVGKQGVEDFLDYLAVEQNVAVGNAELGF